MVTPEEGAALRAGGGGGKGGRSGKTGRGQPKAGRQLWGTPRSRAGAQGAHSGRRWLPKSLSAVPPPAD
eukprot:1277607-Alexandrium_andersonii.AAC.1